MMKARMTSDENISGYTIVELLIACAIILLLAGLVLSAASYAQEKGRRARAESEIATLTAACESYRSDNGIYPQDNNTNALNPIAFPNPTALGYTRAGSVLYQQLSGDVDGNPGTASDDKTNYITPLLKPSSLATPVGGTPYLKDPWSRSGIHAYGYSTSKANGGNGYNPTFDLWSTAGGTTSSNAEVRRWIKNW